MTVTAACHGAATAAYGNMHALGIGHSGSAGASKDAKLF